MIPHLEKKGSDTLLMVHDRPYVMLAGEVHNSNSSTDALVRESWEKAGALGMNTLLMPVAWEMIEPTEGEFHFAIVESMLNRAREAGGKLVLLWFGAWKNAECMYAPPWVKTDPARFHRAEVVQGERKSMIGKGQMKRPYTTLSAFCGETLRADAKAFAALMRYLEQHDGEENTVLAVQVENETGLLGAAREHGGAADEAFRAPVPQDFVQYMRQHSASMDSDVRRAVEAGASSGSWEEVFGGCAEEIFQAYFTASFVNRVAEAGKHEYPLPMVANCWLRKPGEEPGDYPSGGPVSRMHEVWSFSAPEIDILCPDIYVPDFMQVCEASMKNGNPLFIPECATHSYAGPRMVYAVGHYHALCYSPFGFEEMGEPFNAMQSILFGADVTDPALKTPQPVEEYRSCALALGQLMPLITERYGTGDVQAACAEAAEAAGAQAAFGAASGSAPANGMKMPMLTLGKTGILPMFSLPLLEAKNGVVLSVRTGEDEGYLLAAHALLVLQSLDPSAPNIDILDMEEGHFEDGTWIVDRRRNGDEAAFLKIEEPTILHVRTFRYA